MAIKKIRKKAALGRSTFKASYAVLALQPPCGPKSCKLSLCGGASIDCYGPSMVQLFPRGSREIREILELVKQIRKLRPRLAIIISGKPGDLRRIELGLKRP